MGLQMVILSSSCLLVFGVQSKEMTITSRQRTKAKPRIKKINKRCIQPIEQVSNRKRICLMGSANKILGITFTELLGITFTEFQTYAQKMNLVIPFHQFAKQNGKDLTEAAGSKCIIVFQ